MKYKYNIKNLDCANCAKTISHQLRILKSAKLVKYTKIGKTVYYELSDDHVKKLFNIGKEHINEI